MNKRLTWLPFLSEDIPASLVAPEQIARFELDQALPKLAPGKTAELTIVDAMEEGYSIQQYGDLFTIIGGKVGVLYGAYNLLMNLATGHPLPEGDQQPRYGMRMLNCWDNASGDIERGYAGRSLFFENNKFDYDPL
ncbi:MAG: hypothetical protein IJW85_03780, partial [Clostridia bacterium]|nr:hypothetical protein [Clostridia bacterium]